MEDSFSNLRKEIPWLPNEANIIDAVDNLFDVDFSDRRFVPPEDAQKLNTIESYLEVILVRTRSVKVVTHVNNHGHLLRGEGGLTILIKPVGMEQIRYRVRLFSHC